MKQRILELLSYGIFGAVCICINLLFFALFLQLGMHYLLANTVSYAIAVVLNFLLNQKYVFKDAGQPGMGKRRFIRFVLVRLLSLAADNALFYLAVEKLCLNRYFSKILITTGMIMATFVINKLFVFNQNGEKTSETETNE